MALSDPRILYGIHSITPYRRSDGLPYGILKVIGSANLALSTELEQLYAGSNKYAWAAETKTVTTDLTVTVKAYENFLFDLFLGAEIATTAVDANGIISTPVNVLGTSVIKATTGIATIAIDAAVKANLKFGKYVIKALSASTVGIYAMSDIDLDRGTPVAYLNDDLQLDVGTAGAVTVTTVVDTDLNALGITLTGGSATTAFVVGDTATFEIKPPSASTSEIIVGRAASSLPNFGAKMLAQKRATGEIFEIDAHNCTGGGLPINLAEQAFSTAELRMSCLYDATKDRVFTITAFKP